MLLVLSPESAQHPLQGKNMDCGKAGVGWRRVVQCVEGERLIRDPTLVLKVWKHQWSGALQTFS